uniref:Cationic amino acid transporter 6 chloroplastic n=1 Tax=Zea mays TaxID=4577 RepID=A0A804RCI7_MAIZE
MDKGAALASSDGVHHDRPGAIAGSAVGTGTGSSSFASWRAYGRALAQTPRRVARRALAATAPGEEMSRVRARSGADMARALRWWDLVGLGLGGMVGAGVFVTTGRAARLYAGPGVVASYAIAGLCALLSAFCYTEFAVDMPVAGGAFSYLRVTFGELAAFLTGANLIMEYVFSNAAVARSFTAYLGTAVGVDAPREWRIAVRGLPEGFNQVDLVAVAVILLVSVCICYRLTQRRRSRGRSRGGSGARGCPTWSAPAPASASSPRSWWPCWGRRGTCASSAAPASCRRGSPGSTPAPPPPSTPPPSSVRTALFLIINPTSSPTLDDAGRRLTCCTNTYVHARRPLHGGAGAVHGAGHPAQPGLHRHALRLLHGGQRCRVPPLRRGRGHVADARVPPGLLAGRARVHAGLEAGAARAAGPARGPPGRVRGAGGGRGRRVPGAGAAGALAPAVGRPRDAMGARRLRLPQRLPARLAGPPLLRPLRHLLRRRAARLRALQRARQLRR